MLGDHASRGTFREILDKWRKPPRKSGEDPVRKGAVENISKKVFDAMLVGEDTEASAVVHSAIENFAPELAHVTRRFLKSKAGEKPECIAVGGRPLLQPTSTTWSKMSRPRSAPISIRNRPNRRHS